MTSKLLRAVAMNPALVPVALIADVVAFSTPCCLPMIPGFLSYVSALGDEHGQARAAAVRAGVLFTAVVMLISLSVRLSVQPTRCRRTFGR